MVSSALSVDDEVVSKASQIAEALEIERLSGLANGDSHVLQEYYAATTRKLRVDPVLAQAKVAALARGRVVRFTGQDVISAAGLVAIRLR